MPKFEVVTDNSGRINHFVPAGHPGEQILPEAMGGSLDGGERLMIKAVEYDVTANGSLVHPGVEVPESVKLSPGVRLDEDTIFHAAEEGEAGTSIGPRTRIKGTEIQLGVSVEDHALILAQSIGHHTFIGAYVRIGAGTLIGARVRIDPTAKIDIGSQISSDVKIGENARLGFNTRIGKGAVIGSRARIGVFSGAGSRGVNQDGPLVLPGRVVPPSARIWE